MEVENAQIIIKGRAICKYRRRYPNRVRGWNRKALSITDRCDTDGRERPVFKSIEQVIAYKHDNIVGRFSCKGFDTFGPFKLNGGVSKGHPDEKDIAAAIEFYNGLTEQPVFLK